MAQQHNPKIVTDGLIYHLDPTNGGKGGSKILAKPTQISDCVLWLDADDKESIVLNGATVSNWLDKSGGGDHVYQSTSSYQPTYVANSINGRGAIDFDGTDNRLYRGHSVVNNLNFGIYDFCLFIAYENTVVGSSAGVIGKAKGWNADSTDYGFQIYHYLVSGFAKPYFQIVDNDGHSLGGGAVTAAEGAVIGAPNISFMQRKGNSSNGDSNQTATRYINGRNTTNSSSGGIDDITTAQDFYIGKANVDADGGYLNGRVFEVIMYSKALTDAERQQVEYYLSRKWAIPLRAKVTTSLADGVNTAINNSAPVEVTHNNTFYFPNPDDDNCDIRLEGNEIVVADNLPWTIEFWVKRHKRGNVRSTYDGIWGNSYTSSNYERMQFDDDVAFDKLMVDDGAGTATLITNGVDIDCLHKWRHVVVAFDGTTTATTAGCVKQYVDGSDKGPAIAWPFADSKITIQRIGSRGSTSDTGRIEGELGNFRVYNKQLSHAEVLQNYNAQRAKYENKKMSFAAPDNLVLYLDAQSGTSSNYYADGTWYDISGGTANNATRANATFTDEGAKSYDFDGTSDYFTVADDSSLDFGTGDFSLNMWVYLESNTDAGVRWLLEKGENDFQLYQIEVGDARGDNKIQLAIGGGGNIATPITSVAVIDQWANIAATFSGTTAKIYLNGALEDTETMSGGSAEDLTNTEILEIGRRSGYTDGINGKFANIMLYKGVALSADQIVQNYNYFKHRFGK